MVMNLGKIVVDIEMGLLGAVVVAAKQLDAAVCDVAPSGSESLPEPVRQALSDLHDAVQGLKDGRTP